MKNTALVLVTLSVFVLFSGCLKDPATCTTKKPSSEKPTIVAYNESHSYNMTEHSSGLFYEILNPGSGNRPTSTTSNYVKYTGKTIHDDKVFDSYTDSTGTLFYLNSVIAGWQIALPLIAQGGSIRIVVPSSLAYGCKGYSIINPDAILYFDIELVKVE